MAPDVTVLIVNRNAAAYLDPCLRSLREAIGNLSMELILVDAESTDDSVAVTKNLWPAAKVMSVAPSLGYVRANNVGLGAASGRYTMYLNSDTVIYGNAIELLVRFMDKNPKAGAVSSTILNPDGSDQGVVRRFPSIMNGIFGRRSILSKVFPNNRWYRQYMQSRSEEGSEPFETEILSACAMLVRTDLTRKLGGFDERFRFYWVDANLCSRIANEGFRIYCLPAARIMHHEGKGGSTSTFGGRVKMNTAFNHGAYLAYVEYHRIGRLNPLRWLIKLVLMVRMAALLGMLILRPSKATSSGGTN